MSILPMELSEATVRKRGQRIIGPLSLTLQSGGVTVVLGPNGSGKTTLLRALHGLERIASGDLRWQVPRDEAEVLQSFVFQTPIVLRRAVVDNIAYPLVVRGQNWRDARRAAGDWAERVGLGHALNRPATALSAGERQKMALARALIVAPEILFLDEPTANLDGRATRDIEQIVSDARAGGMRIVLATHNLGQARRLGDEVIFLLGGTMRESADAAAFFAGPETSEAAAFLRGDIVE